MLFKSVVGAALFAVAAVAQTVIQFTSFPSSVQVGSTYQITWQGGDSSAPATIILRKGPSGNLGTVETLTTTAVGGSFSWSPKDSLADGSDYAFQIVQGSENNYSGQFTLTGGSTAAASVTSAAASASSTGSSAAASASASSGSSDSSSYSASASSSASASAAATSDSAASSSASATKSATSTKSSSTSTSVPASGASGLQSPVAFILCAVAAMLYLN